ncbi:MAG: hypothetical protein OQJ87_04525, partial [Rhodospirillales bacterium]|nr:hypothetical protein [Rhodospirillales bacterium]MCW9001965.1 hypothetical protein [Rhodospirillales bacterium]
GAWTPDQARIFFDGVEGLPVESVEDPLRDPTPGSLAGLQKTVPFPLAADESLVRIGAAPLIEARAVRRIVLKPMALGGLRAALDIADQAKSANVSTVATTTIDSAAGVLAATHLAAAIDPDRRLAHGLATGEWLKSDIGQGLEIKNGRAFIIQSPGLGFQPLSK